MNTIKLALCLFWVFLGVALFSCTSTKKSDAPGDFKTTSSSIAFVPREIDNLKIKPKYLCFHHSEEQTSYNQYEAIGRYHQRKYGMYGGYNALIDTNGSFKWYRRIGTVTAAQSGHNWNDRESSDTYSICVAGDFRGHLPSIAQGASIRKAVIEAKRKWPDIKIVGHRDLQRGRDCPGIFFYNYYIKSGLLQNLRY
jgi:hypothetical protein